MWAIPPGVGEFLFGDWGKVFVWGLGEGFGGSGSWDGSLMRLAPQVTALVATISTWPGNSHMGFDVDVLRQLDRTSGIDEKGTPEKIGGEKTIGDGQ